MESPILFYAWQSDLDGRFNRWFIEKRLLNIKKTATTKLGLPEGLVIDRDTKNIPGTPEVTATILEKIAKSALFVADVSFVGETLAGGEGGTKKKLPNPNVLLELGYALASLGSGRIVLVMNTAFGSPDEQVFDLKNRRFAIQYELDEQSDRVPVEKSFDSSLSRAIVAALQSTHSAADRAERRLNEDCLKLIGWTEKLSSFPDDVVRMQLPNSYRTTIDRLLDLELLFTHIAQDQPHYAYHWTYVGELVRSAIIRRLHNITLETGNS